MQVSQIPILVGYSSSRGLKNVSLLQEMGNLGFCFLKLGPVVIQVYVS